MQALQKQNKLLKELSETLQRENQCRNREKNAFLQELDQLTAYNEQLKNKIQQLTHSNRNNPGNSDQIIKQMEQRIYNLQMNEQNYFQERQRMQIDICGLIQDNRNLFNELNNIKDITPQDKNSQQSPEIDNLKTQNKLLVQKLENLQNLYKASQYNLDQSHKSQQHNQKQIIHHYQQQIEGLVNELNNIKQEKSNKDFSNKTSNNQESIFLKKQIEKLRCQVQQKQQLIYQKQKQNQSLHSTVRRLEENSSKNDVIRVHELRLNNEQLKCSLESVERQKESYKVRLRDIQIQFTNQKAELAARTDIHKQLSRCIQDLNLKNQENNHLSNILSTLKSSNQMLNNKVRILQSQLNSLQRENLQIISQLQAEKNQNNQVLQQEIQRLNLKLSKLSQDKQSIIYENKKHQKEAKLKNQEILELEKLVKQLRQQNKQIRETFLRQAKQINLDNQNPTYKRRNINSHHSPIDNKAVQADNNQSLKQSIQMLKSQLSHVKADFRKIEQENQRMQGFVAEKFRGSTNQFSDYSNRSDIINNEEPQYKRNILQKRLRTKADISNHQKYILPNKIQFYKQARQFEKDQEIDNDSKNKLLHRNYTNRVAIPTIVQNQESLQEDKRKADKQKWKKWSNLERRISQLQQENKQLKKTLIQ